MNGAYSAGAGVAATSRLAVEDQPLVPSTVAGESVVLQLLAGRFVEPESTRILACLCPALRSV